jgi:hypothetical protein
MLNHASFTVGTTAVLLVTLGPKEPKTAVTVVNDDNNSIYVGDSAVTATAGVDKGVTVKKDSQFIFELHAGDSLYAIAATTTSANAVSVLYSTLF